MNITPDNKDILFALQGQIDLLKKLQADALEAQKSDDAYIRGLGAGMEIICKGTAETLKEIKKWGF